MGDNREQNGTTTVMEEYVELGGLIHTGKVLHAALAAFNKQCRDPQQQAADETYLSIFTAAIIRCKCKYNDGELTTDFFDQSIFGKLGDGYVLGEPTESDAVKKRDYWETEDFESWLAGPEVAGKGLEAAYLVDVCEFGHNNPSIQLETPVLCWRPNQNGRVAYLSGYGSERRFCVRRRQDGWDFGYVLLRKVRQP